MSTVQVIPIRPGADQAGLAEARYWLALLYLNGCGVSKDEERARELMKKAADAGYRQP